jgi:TonB family protein
MNYKDGDYDGNFLTYWENGQLKRKDSYQEGKLLEGKCWNAEGKEVEYYGYELMPVFPGGERGLNIYIHRSTANTSRTIRKWEQGVVDVFFAVDKDGSVTNVKIKKGLSPFLNEEALRVVKSMPKWTPGYQDGEPVVVSYTLPVSFRTY